MAYSRLEQARRQQSLGSVLSLADIMGAQVAAPKAAPSVQFSPVSPKSRALVDLERKARDMFRDPELRDKALQIAAGKSVKTDTGASGIVGSVLSPIGSGLMKALDILEMPKRAVIATIAASSGAQSGDYEDVRNFWTNVNDPTYGTKRYVNTGQGWLDSTIGFIGDVAADPLTYVTLGASQVAGQGGRFALARAAAEAKDATTGLRLFSDDAVKNIARRGRAALTAKEAEQLGVKRAGLYLFGKRLKGADGIGRLTEKTLSGIRVAAGDTKPARFLQRQFGKDEMLELRMALSRGEVPSGKVADVLRMVSSRDVQRSVAARATNEGQRQFGLLVQDIGEADMKQYAKTVHRLIESPELLEQATGREREIAERFIGLFKWFWDDVDTALKDLGEKNGFGQIDNYFPHIITDEGWKYLSDPTKTYSEAVGELLDNPMDTVRAFKHRKLKENREFFGYVLTKDDLTVERLNEIARVYGGFSGDFFETDIRAVVERYVGEYAKQRGIVARWGDLAAGGVLREREVSLLDDVLYDPDQVKEMAKRVGTHRRQLAKFRTTVANALQDAVDEVVAIRDDLSRQIAGTANDAGSAAADAANAGARLAVHERNLEVAKQELAVLRDEFNGMFEGGVPRAAQPVVDEMDRMYNRLEEAQAALQERMQAEAAAVAEDAAAKADLKAALEAVPKQEARRASRDATAESLRSTSKKVARSADAVDELYVNQQLFSAHYEALSQQGARAVAQIEGLSAKDRNWLERAGAWLSGEGSKRFRTSGLQPMSPNTGSMDDFIKGVVGEQPWFTEATAASGAAKTAVAGQSEQTVAATVNLILSTVEATPEMLESAHLAGLWLLSADSRFFGDELPLFLQEQKNILLESLRQADAVIARKSASEPVAEVAAEEAAKVAEDAARAAKRDARAAARAQRLQAKLSGEQIPTERALIKDRDVVSKADGSSDLRGVVGQRSALLRDQGFNPSSGMLSGNTELDAALQEALPFVESYNRLNSFTTSLIERGVANSDDPIDPALLDELRTLLEDALGGASAAVDDASALYATSQDDLLREARSTSNMDEISDAANQAETEVAAQADDLISGPAYAQDGLYAREQGVKKALDQMRANSEYQSALIAAIGDARPTTNRELFAVLARVEDAMKRRAWITGRGEQAGQTITLADLLASGSVENAAAAAARSVARAEAVNTFAGTTHEAATQLVEAMTDYMVLSQVHQTYIGVGISLASRKLHPSADMVEDIARNAARTLRTQWEGRAARLQATQAPQAEIDIALRVVAKLKGMETAPSETFHAALLDELATRLKSRFGELTPVATRSVDKQLAELHGTLQTIAADPFYAKATADKEIHDALGELAGADLHRHVNPDGSAAFLVDGVPLRYTDGTELTFTEQEWEALFDRRPVDVAPEVSAATVAPDPAEVEALVANRAKAMKRIEELKAKKARLSGLGSADATELTRLQRAAKAAAEKIAELQAAGDAAKAATATTAVEVRATAAEKFRVLVYGNGEQRGWFVSGMDTAAWRTADPAVAKGRLDSINTAWEASTEGKILARYNAVAAKADRVAAESTLSSPEHVADVIEVLDDAVADASAKAVAEQEAEVAVRSSVDPAVRSRAEQAAAALRSSRSQTVKARREAGAIAKEIGVLQRRFDSIVLGAKTAAGRKLPAAEAKVARLQAAVTDAAVKFDAAEAIRISRADGAAGVDTLVEQIAAVEEFLQGLPLETVNRASRRAVLKKRSSDTAAKALRSEANRANPEEAAQIIEWLRGADAALQASRVDPNDPVAVVLRAASEAESALVRMEGSLADEEALLQFMEENVAEEISKELADTRKILDGMGLKGMDADPLIVNALTNMQRLRDPRIARQFNSFVGRYTKYFKAYATLSPGFHVRNAISNAVTLMAAGVNPVEMERGLKLWRLLMQHIKDGKAVDDFVRTLPEAERSAADIAVRAFEAAGGGRVEEAFADLMKSQSVLSDWWLLRKSRYWGERVDGAGRFILAYDTAKKGGDFFVTSQRVQRFLVDYMDTSRADRALRNIVPFWMWMSRNIPLHLQNRFANPRIYNMYSSFMNNVGGDDSGEVTPSWLKERGAVKIAANWYLSPDLGFTSMKSTISEAQDPVRLSKYVNPLLRVPVEVLGGTKMYNNVPFSQRPQTPVLGQFGGEILGRLGLAERVGPQGVKSLQNETLISPNDWATSDKLNYFLLNLNPTLGQAERLFPSTETYRDRQVGSVLSYLGLPFAQVTEGSRDSEARRREREMEALKRIATSYGYNP